MSLTKVKPITISSGSAFAPSPSLFQRPTVVAPPPASFAAVGPSRHQVGQRSYKALAGAVWKRRAIRLMVLSGVAAWILLYVALIDGPGSVFSIFSPSCWVVLTLATAIVWSSCILPMLLLKKMESMQERDLSPTRCAFLVSVFLSRHCLQVLATCLLSAVAVWWAFVLAAMRIQTGASLGPFVAIPGREILQYNERPFFLFVMQFATGLSFGIDYVRRERGVLRILSTSYCPTISSRISNRIASNIGPAGRLLAITLCSTLILYHLLRWLLLPTLVFSRWGTILLRARLVAAIRQNAAYSPGLLWRAVVQGGLLVGVLEVTNAMWDVYMTQPWSLVGFDKEPNRCLIDGLTNDKTQHMALLELNQIATSDPAGRQRIFKDIRGSPKPFNAISTECMKVIEQTCRMAQVKGDKSPLSALSSNGGEHCVPSSSFRCDHSSLSMNVAPVAGPSSSKAYQASKVVSPHSAVKTGATVFQPPPKKSLFDRLLAPIPPAPPPSTVSPTPTASNGLNRVPSIFQSPSSKQPSIPSPAPKSTPPRTSGASLLARLAPQSVKKSAQWQWLFEPRWDAKVARCVPKGEDCLLAVEALSCLLAASLTEDPYGVAQGDLPKALEVFVTCLDGLDTLEAELKRDAKGMEEADRVSDTIFGSLRPFQEGLKAGLNTLLRTFSPYLGEMRFPPRIAESLRSHI